MATALDEQQPLLPLPGDGTAPAEPLPLQAPVRDLLHPLRPRLNKPNPAIHIYPAKGKYTIWMRRLFNAVLLLSRNSWSRMPEHERERILRDRIEVAFHGAVADIRALAAFTTQDYARVYACFEELCKVPMVWDVMRDGEREINYASLIAQYRRRERSGQVTWIFVHDVLELLVTSDSYTPLNIELCNRFSSRYTLALYENTFRYFNLPSRTTPWRSVRDWVLLIAGPDKYPDYREFKRTVLKPAMEEIANTPGCNFTLELDDSRRGAHGRIEALRFKLVLKPQTSLAMQAPVTQDPALLARLLDIGIARPKAEELLTLHEEPYVRAKLEMLDRVLRERAAGGKKLKNPAGFLISAIESDWQDAAARHEEEVQKRLEAERVKETALRLRSQWAEYRTKAARAAYEALPDERRKDLLAEYLSSAPAVVRKNFQDKAWNSPLFRNNFMNWLLEQPGVVNDVLAANLELFTAAQVGRSVA